MNPHVSGSQATVAVTACQPACERCVPPADRPLTCHGPAKNPADHGFCKRLSLCVILHPRERQPPSSCRRRGALRVDGNATSPPHG